MTTVDAPAAHYNTALSLNLDSFVPLKKAALSLLNIPLQASGCHLERPFKRSGLTIHLEAYKDHLSFYKDALYKTKTPYYSILIGKTSHTPQNVILNH